MYLYIEKSNGIVRLIPNPDAEISLSGIRIREEQIPWYYLKRIAFRTQFENEKRLCEDMDSLVESYRTALKGLIALYPLLVKENKDHEFMGYTIHPFISEEQQGRYKISKGDHVVGSPTGEYLWHVLSALIPLED